MSLMARLRAACVAMLFLSASGIAFAHGLLMDVTSDGSTITGTVYYTNGERAARESVSLLDLATAGAAPVAGTTGEDGRFSFPALSGHRYRVSAYGEEGHSVEIELVAGSTARPRLVEAESQQEEQGGIPPAWAVIGALLLLSVIPAVLLRRRRTAA